MYLNGDGTPRDLRKAQEVIATGEKTYPYELDFEMTPILRKAIDRCKSDVHKSCPRVDYCKDLATRTLDMEICQAIDQLDGETASSRAIGLLKSKLSVGDNVIFDRAVAEFKAYQLAEMGRAYDASIDGTIRGLAGSGQAAFVRENFQQLMAETLQTHKLKPARLDEYKSVDGEIAELYSSNIREPIAGWQESLNGPEEQERGTSTKR